MNDEQYKIKFGRKKDQIRIRDNLKKIIKFAKKKIIKISEVAKQELLKQNVQKKTVIKVKKGECKKEFVRQIK